jgi:hypothetical protein
MESSTPNTKPGESPKPLGEESRAEANRRFADLEASRIVDGMNRLRKQKIAAQSQKD